MDSCPQYPPPVMELNQEIYPIFKMKLSMDCGPQFPLSGTMELSSPCSVRQSYTTMMKLVNFYAYKISEQRGICGI